MGKFYKINKWGNMKKIGLFTGVLALFFALQVCAELIPLNVVNHDFAEPVVSTLDNFYQPGEGFTGWTNIGTKRLNIKRSATGSDGQFLEMEFPNGIALSNALERGIPDPDALNPNEYRIAAGDIITVRYFQDGSDGSERSVEPQLYYIDGGNPEQIDTGWVKTGFAGKKFAEGTVVHFTIPAGNGSIGKQLCVAFKGPGSGWGRVDNVSVEVERPSAPATYVEKSLECTENGSYTFVDVGLGSQANVTFESWFRRSAESITGDLAGVFMSSDGNGGGVGMHIMPNGELRYHWDGGYWGTATKLIVPEGEWAYTALVIEPEKAVFYLFTPSKGWESFTSTRAHSAKVVNDLLIGGQQTRTDRTFKAEFDEARFWTSALTESQLKYNMNRAKPEVAGVGPAVHYNFNMFAENQPEFYFDGRSNLKIPHDDAFNFNNNNANPTRSFAAMTWVKTSATSGTLFNKASGSGNRQGYWAKLKDSGQVEVQFKGWGGAPNVTSDSVINDGEWHHLAVAVNGQVLDLYIDGVIDATATSGDYDDGVNNTVPIVLGAEQDGSNSFAGAIKDFRIYQHTAALDQGSVVEQDDVQAIMEDGEGTYVITNMSLMVRPTTLNVPDVSGNGNKGFITGAYTRGDSFSRFNSLHFDGGGQQHVKLEEPIRVLGDWSIEFFIKRFAEPSNISNTHLTYRDGEDIGLRLSTYDKTRRVGAAGDKADRSFDFYAPVEEWAHYVFVRTGDDVELFVDGESKGSVPSGTDITFQSIGSEVNANAAWMEIATVRLWNKVLTTDEIARLGLENNGFTENDLNDSALKLYYNFNHQPGDKVLDLTSGSNDGTLTNMPAADQVYLPTLVGVNPELTVTPVSETEVEVEWLPIAGVSEYYLDVATDIAFQNKVEGFDNKKIVNETSINVTDLNSGSAYFLRVRSRSIRPDGATHDAVYSAYSDVESFFLLAAGDIVAVSGDLIGFDQYTLTAGEKSFFKLSLIEAKDSPTDVDVLRDFDGWATVKIEGLTAAPDMSYGKYLVGTKEESENESNFNTIGSSEQSFNIEFENGEMVNEDRIYIQLNNASVDAQDIKISLYLLSGTYDGTNVDEMPSSEREFGETSFRNWGDLYVNSGNVANLTLDVQPAGLPTTINGGVLTVQPELTAKDPFGNEIVNKPQTCVASSPDGSAWHTGGNSVTADNGVFKFGKLTLVNTSGAFAIDPHVTFSISDGPTVLASVDSDPITGDLQNGVKQPGDAMVFDGKGYVNAGPVTQLNNSAGFTYELWIKAYAQKDDAVLISRKLDGTHQISLFQESTTAGSIRFNVSSDSGSVDETVADAFVLNEWTHLALVLNPEETGTERLKVYKNGIVLAQFDAAGVSSPDLGDTPLKIGSDPNGFEGEIDEVRVWNVPRSQQAIIAGLVAPMSGTENGLVVYYNFDGGPGNFTDLSVYANHGTSVDFDTLESVSSFAMGCPVVNVATLITSNGFTANWRRPATVVQPVSYSVDLAADSQFQNIIDTILVTGSRESVAISGLTPFSLYYYRVSAVYEDDEVRTSSSVVLSTTGVDIDPPGNAIVLDGASGSDYVEFDQALNLDDNWTIQTWVKISGTGLDRQMVLADGGSVAVLARVGSGDQRVGLKLGDGRVVGFGDSTEDALADDQWFNLAIVNDSTGEGKVVLYVNGLRKAAVSPDFAIEVAGISAATDGFSGEIDEFAVWNRALTEQEIRNFTYDVKNDQDPNLVLYYNFDLEDSAIIPDLSLQQNVGTVQPGADSSTYVESQAWAVPTAYAATGINEDGFTANWQGYNPGGYILELSATDDFVELIDYRMKNNFVGNKKSFTFTGLEEGKVFFYRVKYNTENIDEPYTEPAIQAFTSLPVPGNCLKFGGDDDSYVALKESEQLKGANLGRFTIEAWVMPADNNSGEIKGIIGSNSNTLVTSAPVLALTDNGDANGKLSVYFGFGYDFGETYYATSAAIVEPFKWTHLSMTYDGSTVTLYKNGSFVQSINGAVSGPNSDKYIAYIGKRAEASGTRGAGGNGGVFNGLVDEVRIWDIARSQQQLMNNFQTEISSAQEGLVGYYRFNNRTLSDNVEDPDNTPETLNVYDLSGNQNDGAFSADLSGTADLPSKLSYAMLAPVVKAPSNVSDTGFTAEWSAPQFGPSPTSYLLSVYYYDGNNNRVDFASFELESSVLKQNVEVSEKRTYYYCVTAVSDVVNNDNGYGTDVRSIDSKQVYAIVGKEPAPGNSLAFDGADDHVTIPQVGQLALGTEDFTVEFWMKEDYEETGQDHVIIANKKYDSAKLGFFFGTFRKDSSNRAGKLVFNFNVTGDGDGSSYIHGSTVVADSTWHHVALTVDRVNSTARLYVDGVLDGQGALKGPTQELSSLTTTSPIAIGITSDLDDRTRFRGHLDDLRVWKSVRSTSEIKSALNNELYYADLPSDLILYYQFDDNSVNDLTEFTNNGTMNGFADAGLAKVWNKSAAMGAPTPLPTSSFTTNSFALNWQAPTSAGVASFAVEVATDLEFANKVVIPGADLISPNVTSFTVGNLDNAVPYFARIISRSDEFAEGERFSDVVAVTDPEDSVPGNALQFDGVNDMVVTTPNYVAPTKNISFSAWVKRESGQLKKAPLFFSVTDPTIDKRYFAIYLEADGEISYRWADSYLKPTGVKLDTVDEWYHVALAFRGGGKVVVYKTDSSGNTSSKEVSHTDKTVEIFGSAYIGRLGDDVPRPNVNTTDDVGALKATIDELQVFKSTLSAEDVAVLASTYPDLNNPVADSILHFQFDHSNSTKYAVDTAKSHYGVLFDGETEGQGPLWVPSGAFLSRPTLNASTDLYEEVDGELELVNKGFVLNWEPVPNAETYTVVIYDLDGNIIETITNITDTSYSVIVDTYGLYEYTVQANLVGGASGIVSGKQLVTTRMNAPGYAVKGEDFAFRTEKTVLGKAPEEFTVEFWLKPEQFRNWNQTVSASSSVGSTGHWQGFTFHASVNQDLYVGTTSGDNDKRIVIKNAFDFDPAGLTEVTETNNDGKEVLVGRKVDKPVWQHFAITYNRGTMEVYRNGRVIAAQSGIAPSAPWRTVSFKQIYGKVDEFRVWSKARSSDEIRNNMSGTVSANSEFLELYYRFDQLSLVDGRGIPDLTGRGLNASVVNNIGDDDLGPSYAMVTPVLVRPEILPIDSDSTEEGPESYNLRFSWKPSEIQPVISRVEVTSEDAPFKTDTSYTIYVSKEADFSDSFATYDVSNLNFIALRYDDAANPDKLYADLNVVPGIYINVDKFDREDTGEKFVIRIPEGTSHDEIIELLKNDENTLEILEPSTIDSTGELLFSFTKKSVTYDPDETYYYRMASADNVVGQQGDVDETAAPASLGLSMFSRAVIVPRTLDAPGNSLSSSTEWPVYVEVVDSPVAKLEDSFTVEMWVNTDVSDKRMPVLSTRAISVENSSGWSIVLDNGLPQFVVSDGSVTDSIGTDQAVADGFWHHVAFAVDRTSNTINCYVDGDLVADSVPLTVANVVGDGDKLFVGQDATGNFVNTYIGSVDEIRIWGSARTSSQIADNMVVSVDVDSMGLLAYYNCDQEGGDILADITAQKNGLLFGQSFGAWKRSAAMGCPQVISPSNVDLTSFTAKWKAPNVADGLLAEADTYELIVANNPDFDALEEGNQSGVVYKGIGTSDAVTEVPRGEEDFTLAEGAAYFYKVTAFYEIGDEVVERTSLVQALSTAVDYFTPPGHSAFFSSDDKRYIEVKSNSVFESPDATVSAWIKPSLPKPGAATWGAIAANAGRYGLFIKSDLTQMRIWSVNAAFNANFTFDAEKWYFVTWVMSRSSIRFYVNGQQILFSDSGLGMGPEDSNVFIGSSNGSSEFFNGRIDEVRMWDHARTDSQIEDNMNFELTGNESGLAAYYKFDNVGDNKVVPDMSQNGNDGVVELGDKDASTIPATWKISAALGCPNILEPNNIDFTSFNARWEAPESVTPAPEQYLLQVSKTGEFMARSTDSNEVSGDAGQTLYSVPVTKLVATDEERSGLLPATTYFYRVRLEIAPGEFRWSEPVIATTLMKAPGYALNFDNTDKQYVDMGQTLAQRGDNLSNFTLEAWVKPRKLDDSGDLESNNIGISGIIGGNFGFSEDPGVPFLAVEDTDGIRFGFVNTSNVAKVKTCDDVFDKVRWYHLALSYSGDKITLYVDGEERDSIAQAGKPKNNYIQYIGRYASDANEGYYDGLIDEVRIWNTQRTEKQIRQNMFTQLADVAEKSANEGLILYYQFNQTDGDIMYDQTPERQAARLLGFEELQSYEYWVSNNPDFISSTGEDPAGSTYSRQWDTSFVQFYNVGIVEGDTLPEDPAEAGGFTLGFNTLAGITEENASKQFLVYGQVMPSNDENRFKTMTWGLDDPQLKSVQVTEQSWYVRNEYIDDDTTLDITFNLRDISPEVYGDPAYPAESISGLTDEAKQALIDRFEKSTADYFDENFNPDASIDNSDKEFQLLWHHIELDSDNFIYRDLTAITKDDGTPLITIEFDKDLNPALGRTDREFYNIRFKNVPARIVRSGTAYNGSYFALGSSIPLDQFALTPAVGLESELAVTEDGMEIRWTVDSEQGVVKYIVQRRNLDGTWTDVMVVMADGSSEYLVLDADYVPGAEYRIMVQDVYGSNQAFIAGKDQRTYFVTLEKGWNLLSLPCVEANVSQLDKFVTGGYWAWDGESYNQIDSAPEALKGFWVYNDTDARRIVEVTGTPLNDTSVALNAGWNLYGPAENCKVPSTVEIVYGWENSTYDQIVKELQVMMTTRGYWIFNLKEETVSLP